MPSGIAPAETTAGEQRVKMIAIGPDVHGMLKDRAKAEGRTLRWLIEAACRRVYGPAEVREAPCQLPD